MCVTFLMLNPKAGADQWQLVLINNRDEQYDRPTLRAEWRDGVLAGRDFKDEALGGTWLAMGETGRIGVLMNILEGPECTPPNAPSRGHLAMDFVKRTGVSPTEFIGQMDGDKFAGFGLLAIEKTKSDDQWRSAYYSNRFGTGTEILAPGVYGFGNCPRNRPFLKVQRGMQLFQQTLDKYFLTTDTDKWTFVDDLVRVLRDKNRCWLDGQLDSQGTHMVPQFRECLSSCFVEFPPESKYGTRTHTVILIDGKGNGTYVERTMDETNYSAPWLESKHEFQLKD